MFAGPKKKLKEGDSRDKSIWYNYSMTQKGNDMNGIAGGITTEEMAEAVTRIIQSMPTPGENEIMIVKNNPNLSTLEKQKAIRAIEENKDE